MAYYGTDLGALPLSENCTDISPTVLSLLSTNGHPSTTAGLLQLANDVLGGVHGTSSSILGEVTDAVASINECWDECVRNESDPLVINDPVVPSKKFSISVLLNLISYQDLQLIINGNIGQQYSILVTYIAGQQIASSDVILQNGT